MITPVGGCKFETVEQISEYLRNREEVIPEGILFTIWMDRIDRKTGTGIRITEECFEVFRSTDYDSALIFSDGITDLLEVYLEDNYIEINIIERREMVD